LGGTDFGPSPYEMLAASLAACTAMTLKIYAKRKDWPLVSAEVHVDHGQIHHADAESGEEKKIDLFSKEIIIEGPLSEEQRKRLKYIASRCPVHLTLLNQIQIESEFK
ncbi:MAG: putative OsmC-like protein, partial [Flavobacteriales bacterium]